ncbi:hypothetical protein LX36DRAFT_660688 [Colletotrichum falcatum]|nr:hypothetical protein LX36DRAFT_660688 [Colletotrichum falcatum]
MAEQTIRRSSRSVRHNLLPHQQPAFHAFTLSRSCAPAHPYLSRKSGEGPETSNPRPPSPSVVPSPCRSSRAWPQYDNIDVIPRPRLGRPSPSIISSLGPE